MILLVKRLILFWFKFNLVMLATTSFCLASSFSMALLRFLSVKLPSRSSFISFVISCSRLPINCAASLSFLRMLFSSRVVRLPRGISSLVVISSWSTSSSQLQISRMVMGDSSTSLRSSFSRSRMLRARVISSSRDKSGTLPISDKYIRMELDTSGLADQSSLRASLFSAAAALYFFWSTTWMPRSSKVPMTPSISSALMSDAAIERFNSSSDKKPLSFPSSTKSFSALFPDAICSSTAIFF